MPGVIPASASQQAPNMTRFSYPGVAGGEAAGKWEVDAFTLGQAKRLKEQTAPTNWTEPPSGN